MIQVNSAANVLQMHLMLLKFVNLSDSLVVTLCTANLGQICIANGLQILFVKPWTKLVTKMEISHGTILVLDLGQFWLLC